MLYENQRLHTRQLTFNGKFPIGAYIGITEDGQLSGLLDDESVGLGFVIAPGDTLATPMSVATGLLPAWIEDDDVEAGAILVTPWIGLRIAELPGPVGAGMILPLEAVDGSAARDDKALVPVAVALGPAVNGVVPLLCLAASLGSDHSALPNIGQTAVYGGLISGTTNIVPLDPETTQPLLPVMGPGYQQLLITALGIVNPTDDPISFSISQGGVEAINITLDPDESYFTQFMQDPETWIITNATGCVYYAAVRAFQGTPTANRIAANLTEVATTFVPTLSSARNPCVANADPFFTGLFIHNNDDISHDVILELSLPDLGVVLESFTVTLAAGGGGPIPTAAPGAPYYGGQELTAPSRIPTVRAAWQARLGEAQSTAPVVLFATIVEYPNNL